MAEGLVPSFEGRSFWLVDALDGTKEFVKSGNDFTVNIALILDGLPVLGIVHAPARGETYLGVADVEGVNKRAEAIRDGVVKPIAARLRPARVIVTGSKSHEVQDQLDRFLAAFVVADRLVVGSSIEFCMVAEGRADLYPRFGRRPGIGTRRRVTRCCAPPGGACAPSTAPNSPIRRRTI